MKLWSIIFCDPKQLYAAMRVKARSRADAARIVEKHVGVRIDPSRDGLLSRGSVLMQYLGESGVDDVETGLIHVTPRLAHLRPEVGEAGL